MSAERPLARHRIGHLEDFEPDVFRVSVLGGVSVGVVLTAQGFFAVRNRCPHQGGEICRGTVGGTMEPSAPGRYSFSDGTLVVACPWHRWEFELATGDSYGRVTDRRLTTYPVEVDDEEQVHVLMRDRAGR